MSAASDFAYAHRLPPEKALAYLAGRKRITPTYSWQDLWQDEHARQFTVSRLARLDLLKAMKDGITASVNGDLTRSDWLRDMKKLLQREGWWGEREVVDPATGEILSTRFDSQRLKLIFDTNTRQAYAAGQWQRIEEAKQTHPYVRYITKGDERVREEHAAWDDLTLPVDDPFWNTHTPPNGYRCRCRITTMTRAAYDLRKGNGSIKTAALPEREIEHVNRKTGEITRAPAGVHPAFAYNPGKAGGRDTGQVQMIGAKIATAPAAAAASTLNAIAKEVASANPNLAKASLAAGIETKPFADWYGAPAKGSRWPVAVIPKQDADAIGAKSGVNIANLSADTAIKQKRKHPEVLPAEYAKAQSVIDRHTAKRQDTPNSLIYVREEPDAHTGGYVLMVKATKTGEGVFITSYRRLSRDEAQRDAEIRRLLKKGAK